MKPTHPEIDPGSMPAACPVCGSALPPGMPPNRCPHCLLRQGLPTGEIELSADTAADGDHAAGSPLPQPGAVFGHYQIHRLLGQGGMGAVFEAEDLDSGRRVALKVLGHRLDSPEARQRFFREGRLAASVNHPHSVYVFGTEEIAGIPAIAMELIEGGTLQDRVSRDGPLPVGDAVDSILQIIDGLEAAQRAGVLHRDIKPANCFVEADGTVKIGDFGLSISTVIRTEPAITASGAFLGTPTFSSPEQLRGDELTVRSDIYAVGVTLFYLLTGHHPFAAPDLVRLLATVLEQPPQSPAKLQPGLPSALCRTVLRCLEKNPDKRFRDYAELRHALRPYASTAPTPATLGLRFLAYALDSLLLAIPFTLLPLLLRRVLPATTWFDETVLLNLAQSALALGYFGLLEGRWGASFGKILCRLRVVRPDRTGPGIARALSRAFLLITLPQTLWLLAQVTIAARATQPPPDSWMATGSLATITLMALYFTTARRHNRFAGLHDLLTNTRVVVSPTPQQRPALPQPEAAPAAPQPAFAIGPYHVLEHLGAEPDGEWFLGFDPCLLRRVWIRRCPVHTPAVPAPLRQLRRPGRLRWLVGRRTDTEAWDAYEAVPGRPLLDVARQPRTWSEVRYWLLDLAEELHAANRDGSLPRRLHLDQIWITAEGRAKLLDFPAPGTATLARETSAPDPAETGAPAEFLRQVADVALTGRHAPRLPIEPGPPRMPLALHASRWLSALRPGVDLTELIGRLRSSLSAPGDVSRVRRLALVALALCIPSLAMLIGGGTLTFTRTLAVADPDLITLRECLFHHHKLSSAARSSPAEPADDLEALETYLIGRFAPRISQPASWHQLRTRIVIPDPLRRHAEALVRRGLPPSPEAFAEASARVEAFFGQPPDIAARAALEEVTLPLAILAVGYANAVILVIFPSLVAALLFRGGILSRILAIRYVDRAGALASRWRVAFRNLLAWSPFLVLLLPLNVMWLTPLVGLTGSWLLPLALALGLTSVSLWMPERGLADRLAGTWPVLK